MLGELLNNKEIMSGAVGLKRHFQEKLKINKEQLKWHYYAELCGGNCRAAAVVLGGQKLYGNFFLI